MMLARIDHLVLRLPGLWLALTLTLIIALPGFFTLPPIDRDEARFAQASAQMLASGDWIDIRLGDDTRYKKPIGIYWLQAATVGLTGTEGQIWGYRLVSLLGALISVGFTYGIARLAMPRAPATLAAVALGACFLLGAEARLAKTDAMLLAAIMAGQYVLARLWLPDGRKQHPQMPFGFAMAFWGAQAASILIKGPIGPMVAILTVAGLCALRRDVRILRALRPLPGIALMLALVVPWFIAITLRSDGAFWQASVGADMIAKIGQGQESHGAPPGTYLALVWATFWPGSVLLAAGIPALWQKGRQAAIEQFALIWAVPVWVVFELTATKLVHYVLPAYPALAVLAAWALWTSGPGRTWIAALLGVVPLAMLAALGVAAGQVGAPLPWTFWVGAAAVAGSVVLIVAAYRRGALGALTIAIAAGGLSMAVGVFPSLARMPVLWPAKAFAEVAARHPDCDLLLAGYGEPSVIFLTGNRVRFVTVEAALAAMKMQGCQVIGLPMDRAPQGVVPMALIEGINIGNGRDVALAVFVTP